MLNAKQLALYLAPLAGFIVAAMMSASGWSFEASMAAGLTLLCALWWVLEPIPIAATSLIPLALFPLFGVLDGAQIALAYGDPLILLLMGGAILSRAMEKSGAHRRLALAMVNLVSLPTML